MRARRHTKRAKLGRGVLEYNEGRRHGRVTEACLRVKVLALLLRAGTYDDGSKLSDRGAIWNQVSKKPAPLAALISAHAHCCQGPCHQREIRFEQQVLAMIRLEHGRVLHPRSDVQQELAKLQRQRAWKGANYHCNACRFQGASGLQVIGGL